jgi:hypothetical protein
MMALTKNNFSKKEKITFYQMMKILYITRI